MNPKTLSEPQNEFQSEPQNNKNDTLDNLDEGHYIENVDR